MDKMFQATMVIAVLLLHLGILYNPQQVHHELFSNPIDSVRIIPSICPHFFQCLLPPSVPKYMAGAFEVAWLPLSFQRGEKLIAHGF